MYLLAAIFSGFLFSLIGIAARIGTGRGIHPLRVIGMSFIVGMIFFSPVLWQELPTLPMRVFLFGLASGVSQIIAIHLFESLLARGPLSALWCSLRLSFIPVIFAASLIWKEVILPIQYIAAGVAVICVVCAAFSQPAAPAGEKPRTTKQIWFYGMLLVLLMLMDSVINLGVKDLSMQAIEGGRTMLQGYGSSFYFIVYAVVVIAFIFDPSARSKQPGNWRNEILPVFFAALGTVGGSLLLRQAMALPAVIAFPLGAVSSIVFTAVVGTIAFKEHRTIGWYGTVIFGVIAVVIANLKL
jgi:hypothetical protein